ncbi:MAG TPA: FAD-dependent monooxygenase [Nostocaceae cyanobacterium]|nr:FAD-dependent monooxygenase [Nostocaceae cyanobacterium]
MFNTAINNNTVPEKAVSNGEAIVIGGSIAGMLAARVLTDHFNKVTIVERDHLPEQPAPRSGVPQSYQIHVLLTQGQRIIEQLFPGLSEELTVHGASRINWTTDAKLLLPGGWAPHFTSQISSSNCSRILLESVIRQRLKSNSRLEFQEASIVTGLLTNTSNTAVTGVRVKNSNGTETELSAQLVIDASGRNSKASEWLQSLGYDQPIETVVNSFLGYSTRWYQSLAGKSLDHKALYIMPSAPDCTRGGIIYQIEGDRWGVILMGVSRDYPPTDETGFLEFARSLRSPEVYEAIKDAQPISPIYGYKRTENRLLHYEKLSRWPENFLVIGDAVCAFNPVYGQGMTTAALGAITLDQCLKQFKQHGSNQDLKGLAQNFQQHLAQVNATPWMMATSDDFRWAMTEGGRPNLIMRLMHWYIDQVMLTVNNNTQVHKVFTELLHLLKRPNALFQPGVLIPVFLQVMNRSSKMTLKTLGETTAKLFRSSTVSNAEKIPQDING